MIASLTLSCDSSDVESFVSSSASSLDSESVSTDRDRRATIDGEVNARGLVPPSDLAGKVCFMNKKSCKLHVVKSESLGVATFSVVENQVLIIFVLMRLPLLMAMDA